jgi:RTX calcium-binding nonapeptide repeat (4 copies)
MKEPKMKEATMKKATTQTQLTISVENVSPTNGTLLTPLWFGIHDGTFDTYDRGRPVSPGLESVAEDGAVEGITREFDLAGFGTVQGAVSGTEGTPGPIDVGETATQTVTLDGSAATSRFFSYASMILPSNDFFVANGNERLHQIFDDQGNFIGADFIILGSQVLDAGSEVNDEIPANTAFFGQQTPNTGMTENGVVQLATGFIPGGAILSTPQFAAADFTAANYQVARIHIFNTLNGDDDKNKLAGTDRDDLINGNGGSDRLYGKLGNDKLVGGFGDDLLEGGEGNDDLYGNEGTNRLGGGNGADRLIGGVGFNSLSGGKGSDQFILAAGEGLDTIADFNLGSGDRLSLSGVLSFSDLTITTVGRNTVIGYGGDELAMLKNVSAASITEGSFA